MRTYGVKSSARLASRVRRLIERDGVPATAILLKLSREATVRIGLRIQVTRGTIAQAEAALSKVDS